MPPGSENGDVRYRIDQGTGAILIGFAFFTDLIDWLIVWIPFANVVWSPIAQFALIIIFFALGVNPFVARPIPGERKGKKPRKKKKKNKGILGFVRKWLPKWLKEWGRRARLVFTLIMEMLPIPVIGAIISLIPWRTINTYLTIEESRIEDEEEAEKKKEEREDAEEAQEEILEQSAMRSRTEEYLGQADQLDPEELALMQDALAQNQSLRDGEREAYDERFTEAAERERGITTADRTRPLGAGEPFGAAKRPSELRRELEAPVGVSDADRRLIGVLNAVDQTRRAGTLRDALKSGGEIASEIGAIPRARSQGAQRGFGGAPRIPSGTLQRQAREDYLAGKISAEETGRIAEPFSAAVPPPGIPPQQIKGALTAARQALRTQQLSRDDYTRIVEASSRIPPIAKNAFLEDLKKHEWTGAKSLDEYQGIINTATGVPTDAKSALFQEMNTALEAARLANSYQNTMALKNDVRAAVRDIIDRREKSGNQKVPIGVNTAADAVFKKIRMEPRNWEPVEDALVDELLNETVAALKSRGLGGEVKVTLRSGDR